MLVTGTRDLADPRLVHVELDKLSPDLVIHGAARGVDAAADAWAHARRGVDVISWAANWQRDGKAAGPIRNTKIVRIAAKYAAAGDDVVCLAMPGSRSVGTHDCGRKARAAGLRIVRVDLQA